MLDIDQLTKNTSSKNLLLALLLGHNIELVLVLFTRAQ
jgi:hypothetical protein